ncbi:MAG: hypothetical protein MUE68_13320 [Bacteroidetes bacterium]|jgi:hypothetical protein|nr:hypothetical protein [Bacteroidota bacterium]
MASKPRTPRTLKFSTAEVGISGDYYQVIFHDELDSDDEPYFLLSTQYEIPDGGVCHFESHHEELIVQCKAKEASLSKNTFTVRYGRNPEKDLVIDFNRCESTIHDLAATLKVMLPGIRIAPNLLISADRGPRERGSRPLNTDR